MFKCEHELNIAPRLLFTTSNTSIHKLLKQHRDSNLGIRSCWSRAVWIYKQHNITLTVPAPAGEHRRRCCSWARCFCFGPTNLYRPLQSLSCPSAKAHTNPHIELLWKVSRHVRTNKENCCQLNETTDQRMACVSKLPGDRMLAWPIKRCFVCAVIFRKLNTDEWKCLWVVSFSCNGWCSRYAVCSSRVSIFMQPPTIIKTSLAQPFVLKLCFAPLVCSSARLCRAPRSPSSLPGTEGTAQSGSAIRNPGIAPGWIVAPSSN